GALSRAHQKHPPSAGDLRSGQSVYGAPVSIALPTGVICLTSPLTVANRRPHTKHRHAHSYTVTGCCNFNGGYLFATPCSDLPLRRVGAVLTRSPRLSGVWRSDRATPLLFAHLGHVNGFADTLSV